MQTSKKEINPYLRDLRDLCDLRDRDFENLLCRKYPTALNCALAFLRVVPLDKTRPVIRFSTLYLPFGSFVILYGIILYFNDKINS